MTNTLRAREWLQVIGNDYLGGLVMDGGASIKFVAPDEEGLRSLVMDKLTTDAKDMGFLVAAVDSGVTRVHLPQEIFFAIAQQIDWDGMAKSAVRLLTQELGWDTDGLDRASASSIVEDIARVKGLEASDVALDLRRKVADQVTRNVNMSRDFRVAMTHLCNTEIRGSGDRQRIVEWLTGVNRRISNVRDYSIYSAIGRTNAARLLRSLLFWVRFVGHSGVVVLLDITRVPLAKNPHDDRHFYSRSAVMDHYELLRELIDGSDDFPGLLLIVLADNGFLDPEASAKAKGYAIYPALMGRIADEVRSRTQANPMAALVRLTA